MENELTIGRIGQISMLCRSAERTETWYRDVLRLHHLYTYGPLVFFECVVTRLYFREVPDDEWRPGSTIYFDVADINVAHSLLSGRGVPFNGEPHMIHRHENGDEEWMAFFSDPDGNVLALMSRVRADSDEKRPAGMTGGPF
jgi:methylmalonyl-CoA/ethylmalonyl-CoA epimerase